MFTKHVICALLVAAAAGSASAGRTEIGPDPSAGVIPAAKRDSGLGELRPLNGESPGVWLYAIPAESLDSGLGDLPPLSEWRAPWLYAMAAEKVDSGLGELPPLSEWRDPWLYAIPAESLDSGLGDLPPLSEWRAPWLYAAPAKLDTSPGRLHVGPAPAAGNPTARVPGG